MQSVDSSQSAILSGHHPLWANAANDLGSLPADQQMASMTLVLQRSPQQEAALLQLLNDQQNPTSPLYHHWLTPAEVGARFGLSDSDLSTLTGWLQGNGLRVNWISPSRIFLNFGGTAADTARAFQSEFHSYNVRGESRFALASEPQIPLALAPAIKAVHGLYTLVDQPNHLAQALTSDSPQVTSSTGNHYVAPADFATIYNIPSAYTGSGYTIGIVGRSRTNMADFDNFKSLTGVGFSDPTEVVPTALGGIDPGPAYTVQTSSSLTGDQGEATLDVLRAGSTAPGANLLLVVATSKSGGIEVDAQYIVQTTPVPAQVMSISFGDCESDAGSAGVNAWDSLFQQAAIEGISVFVSSGDSAAAGCDSAFSAAPVTPVAISPNYICSSSYATCVGGTEFADTASPSTYWNSSNSSGYLSALSYIPEGGWNDPTGSSGYVVAGSGGGVSSIIATPSWQTGTGVPTARSGRYTPDVSFSGSCHDGYFACFAAGGGSCVANSNGGFSFESFCGTSASAPAMAAVAALLDQKLGKAQGNLNPGFYATDANTPSAFHDVTVASSGVSGCAIGTPSMCNNSVPSSTALTGGQTGYLVTTGYDEVTGLGSLNVNSFLNNYSTTVTVTPTISLAGTSVTVSRGASSGNTSTITVTPGGSFTGNVALTASLTSGPTGYNTTYQPTFSFGATTPCAITTTSACTATMTVTTTAATTSALSYPKYRALPWYAAGGPALAAMLLFGIPARRRKLFRILAAVILAALAGGMVACGGGTSSGGGGGGGGGIAGTTTGTYTVTVTGTSGATTNTTAVSVTVQ